MLASFLFLVLATPVVDTKSVWIHELHLCENRNNVEKVFDSNNKYSYGFLMFQESTWLSYGKKFGATMENINDDVLQMRVARSMLDNGESYHWKTCTKKVTSKLGRYPI